MLQQHGQAAGPFLDQMLLPLLLPLLLLQLWMLALVQHSQVQQQVVKVVVVVETEALSMLQHLQQHRLQ